jgi:alpha-1,6-mannosyltransferase
MRPPALASMAAGIVVAATGCVALGAAHGTALVPGARHADPAWLAGPLRWVPSVALGHRGAASLCAVALVAYLGALRWASAARGRALLAGVGLAWLLVVLGPPLLAADVFSYLNDARLVAVHGLDPYVAGAGADPADPVQPFLGWHTGTSPYGALFTVASIGPGLLGPAAGLWALKVVALFGAGAVVAATWRLAAMRGQDPRRAALLVGLNPLLVVWVLGGAHNDLLALALQLWALVLLLGGAERAGPGMLTLAVGIKASAGVAVPFVVAARRSRGALLGAAAGLVVVATLGWAIFGSAAAGLDATLADGRHLTRLSLPALGARILGDTGVAPGARAALQGAAALIVSWLLWRVARGRTDPLAAAGWATMAVLGASTWLLPWYGVWLLPPAALGGDRRLERAVLAVSAYLLLGRALL